MCPPKLLYLVHIYAFLARSQNHLTNLTCRSLFSKASPPPQAPDRRFDCLPATLPSSTTRWPSPTSRCTRGSLSRIWGWRIFVFHASGWRIFLLAAPPLVTLVGVVTSGVAAALCKQRFQKGCSLQKKAKKEFAAHRMCTPDQCDAQTKFLCAQAYFSCSIWCYKSKVHPSNLSDIHEC